MFLFYALGAALPLLAFLKRNWPPLLVYLPPIGVALWGLGLVLVAGGVITDASASVSRASSHTYRVVYDAGLIAVIVLPPLIATGFVLSLSALRALLYPRLTALSALALHVGLFTAQFGLVFFMVFAAPRRYIDPPPIFVTLNLISTIGATLALAGFVAFLSLTLLSAIRRSHRGPLEN